MPDWLTWTVGVLSIVFGGGGVAALYKARKDHRLGVRQQETAEDAAWDERWKGLIKAQAEAVVAPLERRVTAQGQLIEQQGRKIETLETELGSLRTRYWRSIHYIRDLLAWIAKHMPNADPPPPVTPADIAEDI